MIGVVLAIVAAVSLGMYGFLGNRLSASLDPMVAAIGISLCGVLAGLLVFPFMAQGGFSTLTKTDILMLAGIGVCVLMADLFFVKASQSGLGASIVGPIYLGGSVAAVSLMGMISGEPVSLLKVCGIFAIIGGVVMLSIVSGGS